MALKGRDKSAALVECLTTFLDGKPENVETVADVMAYAAATPRGTYERWGIENFFKRQKALVGRGQARNPLYWFLDYGYGLLFIAAMSLWRLNTQRSRVQGWERFVARTRFVDPMKQFIVNRFCRQPARGR